MTFTFGEVSYAGKQCGTMRFAGIRFCETGCGKTGVGGISKGALYDAVRSGVFPEPIRVTEKTVAWDVEDIRAFREQRKEEAKARRRERNHGNL